jgi:hypothetical protein
MQTGYAELRDYPQARLFSEMHHQLPKMKKLPCKIGFTVGLLGILLYQLQCYSILFGCLQ